MRWGLRGSSLIPRTSQKMYSPLSGFWLKNSHCFERGRGDRRGKRIRKEKNRKIIEKKK